MGIALAITTHYLWTSEQMHLTLSQDARQHTEWHLEACMLLILSPMIIGLLVMPFPTARYYKGLVLQAR